MYQKLTFTITGMSPLLMHNGLLADPQYPWTKLIKEISGKRKKTDQDLADMARLEWFGSLYIDEKNRPALPGENIERMLVDAAKKERMGKEFTSAIISDGLWPLVYDGPSELDALYADGKFIDRRGVKVQSSRVIRVRPIFHTWSLKFEVAYLPSVLNADKVRKALDVAGQIIGLGDFRPKFGRFAVES